MACSADEAKSVELFCLDSVGQGILPLGLQMLSSFQCWQDNRYVKLISLFILFCKSLLKNSFHLYSTDSSLSVELYERYWELCQA